MKKGKRQKSKIFVSVIIPTYNQASATTRLLASIVLPKNVKSEVIVVDDGSQEKEYVTVKSRIYGNQLSHRCLRHPENRGVAAARNTGARASRGEIFCFIDGDVELFPDTLEEVVRVFQLQPGVGAVSGIVVPESQARSFFPRYKSLRTWAYWMEENRGNPNRQTLGNACFAVRRDIFKKVGGFNERFRGASIEDNELGNRIAKIAPVIFTPAIRIRHTYESFWPMVKRYMTRSALWTRLFWERRQFETAGMSRGETINGMVASAAWIFPPLLALHFFLGRRFYGYVRQREGWLFMCKSLAIQLLLYPLIYITAAWMTIVVFAKRISWV